MKKTLYLFLAVSLIFTSCKKEEGCTDPIASNYNADAEEDDNSCTYSIIGVWTPNSVSVNANLTVSVAGVTIQSFDTSWTMTPQDTSWELQGNIEFTNDGYIITTNEDGELETDSYTTSGSSLTVTNADGEEDNATYTVTKTNLAFTISDTDTGTLGDGSTETISIDMTINCTRQ